VPIKNNKNTLVLTFVLQPGHFITLHLHISGRQKVLLNWQCAGQQQLLVNKVNNWRVIRRVECFVIFLARSYQRSGECKPPSHQQRPKNRPNFRWQFGYRASRACCIENTENTVRRLLFGPISQRAIFICCHLAERIQLRSLFLAPTCVALFGQLYCGCVWWPYHRTRVIRKSRLWHVPHLAKPLDLGAWH